ncbi:hypothetical protein [Streptomyces gougerotii]|nr:hypothetical protein [Streptomyces gougerotii]
MVVSVASLALLILVLQAVLDPAQTDWGNELTLRFLAVDIICLAAFVKRKSLHSGRAVPSTGWSPGTAPAPGATTTGRSAGPPSAAPSAAPSPSPHSPGAGPASP